MDKDVVKDNKPSPVANVFSYVDSIFDTIDNGIEFYQNTIKPQYAGLKDSYYGAASALSNITEASIEESDVADESEEDEDDEPPHAYDICECGCEDFNTNEDGYRYCKECGEYLE